MGPPSELLTLDAPLSKGTTIHQYQESPGCLSSWGTEIQGLCCGLPTWQRAAPDRVPETPTHLHPRCLQASLHSAKGSLRPEIRGSQNPVSPWTLRAGSLLLNPLVRKQQQPTSSQNPPPLPCNLACTPSIPAFPNIITSENRGNSVWSFESHGPICTCSRPIPASCTDCMLHKEQPPCLPSESHA